MILKSHGQISSLSGFPVFCPHSATSCGKCTQMVDIPAIATFCCYSLEILFFFLSNIGLLGDLLPHDYHLIMTDSVIASVSIGTSHV